MEIEKLLKIRSELKFIKNNICKGCKYICSPLYRIKVSHLLLQGKEALSEKDLNYLGVNFYFFAPLEEALEYCGIDCEISKFYYRIAEKFIDSLIKSFK